MTLGADYKMVLHRKRGFYFYTLIIAIFLYSVGACGENDTDGIEIIEVSTIRAELQSFSPQIKANGTVSAKRKVTLVAQIDGPIVSVSDYFFSGGSFKRNEEILRVEHSEYIARHKKAESIYAEQKLHFLEQEALFRTAGSEWSELGTDKSNDMFLRKPHLSAAKANLESAEADLDASMIALNKAKTLSPFDALVIETYVTKGQFIIVGTPIAEIYDKNEVEIKLMLTERQASKIDLPFHSLALNSDTSLNKRQMHLKVDVIADIAGKRQRWKGDIARMLPVVDSKSRLFQVYVDVKNPFGLDKFTMPGEEDSTVPLLPGLFVEVEIPGREVHDVYVLPKSVIFDKNQIYVYTENGKLEQYEVDIIHNGAEKIWFLSSMPNKSLVLLNRQRIISTKKNFKLVVVDEQDVN